MGRVRNSVQSCNRKLTRRGHLTDKQVSRQPIELLILHRLNDVLEESVPVRKDLAYPILITPYAQFVVMQSAIWPRASATGRLSTG